ncbi:HEAT repeat domain-containing protein [bacterium]|nr:HEAT repeat domain-containing protein [bacterium]
MKKIRIKKAESSVKRGQASCGGKLIISVPFFPFFLFLLTFILTTVNAENGFILLKSTDSAVRINEAQRLGNERVEEAVPDLIELLNDKSAGVRINAAVSLSNIGDERAVEPLLKVLKNDKIRGVRVMAAQSLGRFGDKRAASALKKLAEDKDPEMRRMAYGAMGKSEGGGEAAQLIEALKDAHWQVRQTAVDSLMELTEMGKTDRKAIKKAIKEARKDKDIRVKKSAEKALKRLDKMPEEKK